MVDAMSFVAIFYGPAQEILGVQAFEEAPGVAYGTVVRLCDENAPAVRGELWSNGARVLTYFKSGQGRRSN